MKRKVVVLAICCTVVMGVTACGNKSNKEVADEPKSVSSSVSNTDTSGEIENTEKNNKTDDVAVSGSFDEGVYSTDEYQVKVIDAKVPELGTLYIEYELTCKSGKSIVPSELFGYDVTVEQGSTKLQITGGSKLYDTPVKSGESVNIEISYSIDSESVDSPKVVARDAEIGDIVGYYTISLPDEKTNESEKAPAKLSGEAGDALKGTKQYKDEH